MDGFKRAKTLLEEQREKGIVRKWERPIPEAGEPRPGPRNMRRPKDHTGEICEQWTPGGCKAMLEAVELGLTKTTFICTGIVTTTCGIRTKLAAGTTIMELYEK